MIVSHLNGFTCNFYSPSWIAYWNFLCCLYSKPVSSGHSKIDKTKILMTNGSLMQVESIAECSLWSILWYFWPALSGNYTPPPPKSRKLCLWWVYCFHGVRPCVHLSAMFCFLNILKSLCWIFIKLCKHVHICKTNTFNKKVRARGQFY